MGQHGREILFRGKRKDTGDWIFGSLVHQFDYYGITVDRYFILEGTDTNDYDIDHPIEVIGKTVGQYTGLTDKNGAKVFEGDLFFYNWGKTHTILMSVIFEDGEYRLQKVKNYEFKVWNIRISGETGRLEISGNIYDKPGLIEEGDNG